LQRGLPAPQRLFDLEVSSRTCANFEPALSAANSADGERIRRRLGANAWVVSDGAGGWRPRDGRPSPGQLTEYQARRRMAALVETVEAGRAEVRARSVAEAAAGGPTFRALAHLWLEHVEYVLGAKPATLRDYRSMLAEPGRPYRRGKGRAIGRIMAALGDAPAAKVTTAQIEALLVAHAREGVGARSVNKHRQVLSAIFNFGLRPENAARWQLTGNPAASTTKRREDGPGRLEVFSVEQVEALARAAQTGRWRGTREHTTAGGELLRAEEDAQLGELLRIAAYTGLRRGELVTLRWRLPSATIGGSPPIAARASGDAPTATIRPSRTATASAYGRATSIVTTSPSKMNAHASSLATPKTLRAFSRLARPHGRSPSVPAARSAGVGGAALTCAACARRAQPGMPSSSAAAFACSSRVVPSALGSSSRPSS